jgi:thiol:disulfide interchange protein
LYPLKRIIRRIRRNMEAIVIGGAGACFVGGFTTLLSGADQHNGTYILLGIFFIAVSFLLFGLAVSWAAKREKQEQEERQKHWESLSEELKGLRKDLKGMRQDLKGGEDKDGRSKDSPT